MGLLTVQDRPCPSRRGESGSDLSTTPALVEATSCLHFCPLPQGPRHSAALAQAEELLEQQLEIYQALLEGQEGAWEAQALVLKIQKLKEQMRRHRESLGRET